MNVLQGRIAGATIDDRPSVAQAFNDACQRYFMQAIVDDNGDPILDTDDLVQFEQKPIFQQRAPLSQELRAFYAEALSKAEQIYGRPKNSQDRDHLYNKFNKEALEFLDNTYVWSPSVEDAKYDEA